MNVTEAVDSLSAMFHLCAQLTHPHLPVAYLHITLRNPPLHLFAFLVGNRITWSSLWNMASNWGKSVVLFFSIKHIMLKSFKMDQNWIVCCDFFCLKVWFSTWISNFRKIHIFSSPYKHVTTCPRRTLATHSRRTRSIACLLILTTLSNKLFELWGQKTTF